MDQGGSDAKARTDTTLTGIDASSASQGPTLALKPEAIVEASKEHVVALKWLGGWWQWPALGGSSATTKVMSLER